MNRLFCFALLVVFVSCKDKYVPKVQSTGAGYLVVEGFINSGGTPSTFSLTRTTKLYDTADIVYEQGAAVTVQGENQENYPLTETSPGTYVSGSLALNPAEKYRLHITTQDGKEYVSDFEPVRQTVPIDSVSWQRTGDGITLYVSTHDPQTNPGYYRWDYDETWEFHSAFESSLYYVKDPSTNEVLRAAFRNPDGLVDTTIYKCWRNEHSTNITLGSTEKLSSDVIYLPFHQVANGDQRLSVLYSINVKQFSLSKEAYNFYNTLKINTEQLGSIFDPSPTSLPSNLHCVSDPSETVVGYVSVTEEQDKRIFIRHADVPGWDYYQDCQEFLIDNNRDSILVHGAGTLPTEPAQSMGQNIASFFAAQATCVDCTLTGSNVRPAYWP